MTYLNLLNNPKKGSSAERNAVNDWARLERFLILGDEDGAYSVQENQATAESLRSVQACLRSDGLRVVRSIVEIATSGRAPRNTPSLQVLALASSSTYANALTNATALAALPEVARTAADLCTFASLVDGIRGWGRGLRTAIADWYLSKPAGELAFQMMKESGAAGWTHADLIRLSHPKAETPALNAVFQWAVDGALGHLATADIRHGELRQVYAFEQVNKATSESEVVRWIEDDRLTHEMVPQEWKQSARVWEALLENMPYAVMVSQLGKMTEVGLLGPHSAAAALVVARLMDRKRVANAKVHPVALLSALLAYRQNHAVANILDALEDAFYLAFDNVEPTGRRIYLAVDSGASPQLAAALGMAFVRSESGPVIAAFHDQVRRLKIGAKDPIEVVCQALAGEPGPSDASLPMHDARQRGVAVDAFVLLTGDPAWAGDRHPERALEEYRQAMGIPAKLVVVGMTATHCGIAGPADAAQLEIAGFDPSVPSVIAGFLRS